MKSLYQAPVDLLLVSKGGLSCPGEAISLAEALQDFVVTRVRRAARGSGRGGRNEVDMNFSSAKLSPPHSGRPCLFCLTPP